MRDVLDAKPKDRVKDNGFVGGILGCRKLL